jgi:hypothetical protein
MEAVTRWLNEFAERVFAMREAFTKLADATLSPNVRKRIVAILALLLAASFAADVLSPSVSKLLHAWQQEDLSTEHDPM